MNIVEVTGIEPEFIDMSALDDDDMQPRVELAVANFVPTLVAAERLLELA